MFCVTEIEDADELEVACEHPTKVDARLGRQERLLHSRQGRHQS